jgi:hypothetical protein
LFCFYNFDKRKEKKIKESPKASIHLSYEFNKFELFLFSLRYMKYLYPYECEKEKLSSPDELQSAIDGNRREGRRSSYGQYPDMVGATPPPSHINRNHTSHHTSPLSLVSRQLNGHNSQGLSSGTYC